LPPISKIESLDDIEVDVVDLELDLEDSDDEVPQIHFRSPHKPSLRIRYLSNISLFTINSTDFIKSSTIESETTPRSELSRSDSDISPSPKSQWVPDDASEECLECFGKFTLVMNRRHHCRSCGIVSMKTILKGLLRPIVL
jgi:hypothetical protein